MMKHILLHNTNSLHTKKGQSLKCAIYIHYEVSIIGVTKYAISLHLLNYWRHCGVESHSVTWRVCNACVRVRNSAQQVLKYHLNALFSCSTVGATPLRIIGHNLLRTAYQFTENVHAILAEMLQSAGESK